MSNILSDIERLHGHVSHGIRSLTLPQTLALLPAPHANSPPVSILTPTPANSGERPRTLVRQIGLFQARLNTSLNVADLSAPGSKTAGCRFDSCPTCPSQSLKQSGLSLDEAQAASLFKSPLTPTLSPSPMAVPAADADENSSLYLSGKAIFGGTQGNLVVDQHFISLRWVAKTSDLARDSSRYRPFPASWSQRMTAPDALSAPTPGGSRSCR